jgi:hypothetical protein
MGGSPAIPVQVRSTPIRVRPAPPSDPPYDDEAPALAVALAQQPLPLDWLGSRSAIAPSLRPSDQTATEPVPRSRPGGRLSRGTLTAGGRPGGTLTGGGRPGRDAPASEPTDRDATSVGPAGPEARRPGRRTLPSSHVAAIRFVHAYLEVLNGYRPASHLRALMAPADFATASTDLAHALERIASPRRTTGACRAGTAAALAATARSGATRVRLRELRMCEPRPGIAEAAAVLGDDRRSWALAVRLEAHGTGWQCTVVKII